MTGLCDITILIRLLNMGICKYKINKKVKSPSKRLQCSLNEFSSDNTVFTYIEKYKKIPEFSDWLDHSPTDKTQAYCKYCNENRHPRSDSFRRHASTEKHKLNYFKFHDIPRPISDLERAVETAAILLSGLFAVKNLPLLLCDTLIPLLKRIFPDSKILENLFLSRFRMTEIIKKLLAASRREKLQKILQNQEFSFIIDESTDHGNIHSMCIVVRYVDEDNHRINESLWDLVDVYDAPGSLASAEQLNAKILKSFEDRDVPRKNMYGFCSDTCNCMLLVAKILEGDNSNVFYTKCPAHMEQLCAKQAAKVLPRYIEENLSSILNFISGSSKRSKMWYYLQIELKLKPLKVIRPGFTRWTSWIATVRYVLFRYTALKEYFARVWALDNNKEAAEILSTLDKPIFRQYLVFLHFILSKFSLTNVTVQSISPVITEKSDKMTELMKDILSLYMNESYVSNTKLQDINPNNDKEMVALSMMNVGDDLVDPVQKTKFKDYISPDDHTVFLKKCRQFLITAASDLKKRLQLDKELIPVRHFFHPNNALDEKFHKEHTTLDPVFEALSFELADDFKDTINSEWRNLQTFIMPEEILNEKKIDEFWLKISGCLGENDCHLFSNLSKFVLLTMVIVANSNASSERVWSRLNLIKTLLRTKLDLETLFALLLSAELIKDAGGILNFTPSEEMIRESQDIKTRYLKERKDIETSDDTDLIRKCKMDDILFNPTTNKKARYFNDPTENKMKNDKGMS